MNDLSPLARQMTELRAGFHQSFARPTEIDADQEENLLAIRVGDDVFAIRLQEISGLHADKPVTRVPGAAPALAGLVGFRSTILPVYSLAVLLGIPARASPRWLVVMVAVPAALSFDAFEQHIRVTPDAIRPRDGGARHQAYIRDFVTVQQFVRPILHLPSLLDTVSTRNSGMAPGKER